ncbi:MAG: ribonuclease HI family protein [Deltaproteobacteria bacterium]|nr:ribonuclease HI family protein [Deltaproteobacteria bacterium]
MTPSDPIDSSPSFSIYTDGASRGNPGDAGYGAVITDDQDHTLAELNGFLGKATNNVAEYKALIMALEKALALGLTRVGIYMDSELVVRQLTGRYKVRDEHLQVLHRQALKTLERFACLAITHIPREKNHRADRLANAGIDEHFKKQGSKVQGEKTESFDP